MTNEDRSLGFSLFFVALLLALGIAVGWSLSGGSAGLRGPAASEVGDLGGDLGPVGAAPGEAPSSSAAAAQPALRRELAEDERATIRLFQEASPAAVYITSLAVRRDVWTLNLQEYPQGSGSGFLWDRKGHVITNFHVIRGASRAEVTLSDHSTWEAELVGAAPEKDLAVLRIDAPADLLDHCCPTN